MTILMLVAYSAFSVAQNANESNGYQDGSQYSQKIVPDLNKIREEDSKKFIEGGFQSNPEQKKYYQGITSGDNGALMTDGINTFNKSEFKQPITEAARTNHN